MQVVVGYATQAFASGNAHFLKSFYAQLLERPLAKRVKTSPALDAKSFFRAYLQANSFSSPTQPAAFESIVERSESPASDVASVRTVETVELAAPQARAAWLSRLKQGLAKTRGQLSSHLFSLLRQGTKIDANVLENIESELLAADIGVSATRRLIESLERKLKRHELANAQAVYEALSAEMVQILSTSARNPLENAQLPVTPFVLLVVGVNGVGKTTTIGKLAHHQVLQGRKVLLAAGDTFRAAAVEQLKIWAKRLQVPIIAQQTGADSASVIFDAFEAAKARGVDLLIADTAGRLHTKDNLMEELKKIKRVLQKKDLQAPHAVLLVLDAGNGQNALNQAQQFHQTLGVDGVVLTKLDGTAKGGISFAIAQVLQLPIWYIGLGEQAEDLRAFHAPDFVQALLEQEA